MLTVTIAIHLHTINDTAYMRSIQYLYVPDTSVMVEEGACLANMIHIVEVPHIKAVVIVHHRQLAREKRLNG